VNDRGLVLAAAGSAPELEEIELDPPGEGEVRVRIAAVGVCHTDLHVVETGGWGLRLPVLLGHEAAAVVEEVGAGVERVAPGDPVVLAWRVPCGSCPACGRGAVRRCPRPKRAKRRARRVADGSQLTPALLVGALATRAIVHAEQAVRVPRELPPEQACLIGCAVATGVGAVVHTAGVWEGARVGVIGCGGVGLAAVQGARIAGAAEILAVDVAGEKREQARRFGATEALAELPPDSGLDFAFDAVGRPQTLAAAVASLGHGGVATLVGIPPPGEEVRLDLQRLFDARAQVRVSHGGDHLPAEDLPLLARLALDGRLDLAGMVSRTVGLEDAAAAVAHVGSGDAIRTVVRL
jgi:S-(hydroxymethyl)mycothiol dehydrogenase